MMNTILKAAANESCWKEGKNSINIAKRRQGTLKSSMATIGAYLLTCSIKGEGQKVTQLEGVNT